jgi:hypothetical protein
MKGAKSSASSALKIELAGRNSKCGLNLMCINTTDESRSRHAPQSKFLLPMHTDFIGLCVMVFGVQGVP